MNKRQKQLINTYFRKREIAYKQQNEVYEPFEIYQLYKMGVDIKGKTSFMDIIELVKKYPEMYDVIDFNDLSPGFFAKLIAYDPEYINKTPKDKLNDMQSYYISDILQKTDLQTALNYDFFKKLQIDNLYPYELGFILRSNPDMVKMFPTEKLNEIHLNDVVRIVHDQPKLIKYFQNRDFHVNHINYILQKQPQLKSFFKKRGMR